MTFLHLLVLALGTITAIAASDLLSHRQAGPWPVGLVALALVPVAGWLYSPWIAAFALGLALGAGVVIVASWSKEFRRRRLASREQAKLRADARSHQLGGSLERRS